MYIRHLDNRREQWALHLWCRCLRHREVKRGQIGAGPPQLHSKQCKPAAHPTHLLPPSLPTHLHHQLQQPPPPHTPTPPVYLLLLLFFFFLLCSPLLTDSKKLEIQSQLIEREIRHGEVRAGAGDRVGQLRGGQADAQPGHARARRHEVHRARIQDRRERVPGDREPPVAAAPQHHPLQGGGAHAHAPGHRHGVRRRRRALRAHLRRRPLPRGRGALLLPAARLRRQLLPRHADLPPRPQAREHPPRRQPRAATQDLRLRILKVVCSALAAQVDGGHAGVHRAGGAVAAGVRREARGRVVVRGDALRHAGGRLPVRGHQGPQELPQDHRADHVGAVQDPRVRARLADLPPPALPHLRRRPAQAHHHGRDQGAPLVPQEPAAGAQGGGAAGLLQPPARRRRRPRLHQWRRDGLLQRRRRSGGDRARARAGLLGAERGGDHEDRAGGADGAQARQAGDRVRLGHRRRRGLRRGRRQPGGGGGGVRRGRV